MLHTMEQARRRGLGQLVTTDLLLRLIERRQQQRAAWTQAHGDGAAQAMGDGDACWQQFCYVEQGNAASLGLLQLLGVVPLPDCSFYWCSWVREGASGGGSSAGSREDHCA
jgi:hypothetical protein